MKQGDIALVIIVAFIAGIMSFIITGMIFGKPTDLKTEVEKVEPITAEIPPADTRYFNADSINPTQIIRIGGEQDNSQPF